MFGLLAVGVAAVGARHRAPRDRRARRARVEEDARAGADAARGSRHRTQARWREAEGALGGARAFLLAADRRRLARASRPAAPSRSRIAPASGSPPRTPSATAARAVDLVYELGGGTAIYRASPLQRCFRDVHVVTQHAMVAAGSLELAGRALLGVDADYAIL